MRLVQKFLGAPIVATVMMVGVGTAATMVMLEERAAVKELHERSFQGYSAALKLDGGASALHAHVYRTMNWIGNLSEAQLKRERETVAARVAELQALAGGLVAHAGPQVQSSVDKLRADLQKYGKTADTAIDMASVDVNTGATMMASADKLFVSMAESTAQIARSLSASADEAFEASVVAQKRGQWLIWGATVLAALLAAAVSILISRSVLRTLERAREFAGALAEGRLDAPPPARSADEVGDLVATLGSTAAKLRETVTAIKSAADQINTASSEIATGNADLSGRTEAAASSLEQTASSVEHLTQTVRGNADSARQANQLALSASEVAQRGGSVVGEVVTTMGSITESSRKIVEIIGVIDGIAFQTNILALNAAVEAARAGEQGRGFAVVAGEVRTLAQRSAEAAAQIKTLITASVNEVEAGSKLVNDAGETMKEIVTSVRRVTDIIGEISSATDEQSGQIGQVNSAVGQLDQMTQQNAALVEQSAAAAESLRSQASALTLAVSTFRVGAHDVVFARGAVAATAPTASSHVASPPSSSPSGPRPAAAKPGTAKAATAKPAAPSPRAAAQPPSQPSSSPTARSSTPPPAARAPVPRAGERGTAAPAAESGPRGGSLESVRSRSAAMPASRDAAAVTISAAPADGDWETF